MKTMGKRAWLSSLAVVAAAFAALAPAAAAETINTGSGEAATIPASGKANTYPSFLKVQGGDGNMTDVNVKLTLSQTFPNDLDIALVSPDGDAEILLSDACGEVAAFSSIALTFDSEAGTGLSEGGSCSSGTFQPTNFGGGDTWESPGPSVTTNQLANFNGEDPNGFWELFIVDDNGVGGGSGTLVSWSLTITTGTAEVIIPGTGTSGVAKPYPSTKTFSTAAGQVVSDVNFETPDFNHTFPDDVDMLLAGPRADAKTILMSDACGGTEHHDFVWTFDDEAGASLSNGGPCSSGTFKPTDFEVGDVFPAPAPGGPYPTSMAVFDGLEGGAFQLFALDDVGTDTGFLTSWTLKVTTRDAADTGLAVASLRVEEGGKAVLEVKRTGPAASSLGPATLNLSLSGTATAGTDYTAPSGTLEFARGEASKKIEIPIADDKVGEATERFKVTLSSPRDDARLVGNASTEVTIGPDNEFKFGKLKKNPKKGTAKLFVKVPGPGQLVLSGEQVKKAKKTVKKAGNVGIVVKPKGNAVNLLEEAGSAKLRARVAFTPTDGSLFTKFKKLKLVLGN